MVDLCKNIDKLFFSLLAIVLLCSANLFDARARASSRDYEAQIEEATNNDSCSLRGEIWYGDASWYGPRFHGRRTSNGERFDKHELTAAHRTLPFNTKVLVTNLRNNKQVIVRINDRGPFIDNRIIDLSEEAAEKIDARRQGISYIKLQILNPLLESQILNSQDSDS